MKVLGWILGIVVLLVVGIGAYVAMNSGDLVKKAIEEFGPEYLGVNVEVAEVNLDLAAGSAQIKGLMIGNPQGFAGADMMSLDEILVVLDTTQVSEQLVVMKEVRIDGASVTAIAKGKETNFQQLMENLSGGGDTPADEASSESESETKFVVEQFIFTNAKAALSSDVLGDMDLNLPDIRLTELGRKSNGATAKELAQEIFKPISSAISQAVMKQSLDLEAVKENVRGKIEEKLGGLKGLTDRFKRD